MDEFAQTRGADDLFDDDFTPIVEPEPQRHHHREKPATLSDAPAAQQQQQQQDQKFYKQVPRGPKNAHHSSNQPLRRPSDALPTPSQTTNPTTITTTKPSPATSTPPPDTTPTTSTTPRPPPSVRGDRLATGGTPKPKLTDTELATKLAAAKLNSQKLAEAHRLAEADEASFQQREARATERRKEEGRARRVMDIERERNRLRKLEAGKGGGREWDEGKEEEVGRKEGRGWGFRRGVNGRVGSGERNLDDGGEEAGYGRRGRGGYGGRGQGRGRGRGDRGEGGRGRGGRGDVDGRSAAKAEQKAPDPIVDFPALPAGPKPVGDSTMPVVDKVGESLESPLANGASWADQVNEKES